MDRFECRFSDKNGIFGDWMEANDHESVAKNVFGPNKYIYAVRYQYKDGTFAEYRRINLVRK